MKDKKIIIITIVSSILIVIAGALIAKHYILPPAEETVNALPKLQLGDPIFPDKMRPYLLHKAMANIFSPSKDGMFVMEREILSKPLTIRIAEAVITKYLKGLKEGLRDAKLLGVYRDRKNNILYIDLSVEFRRNFSGDVEQEYYLLKSLFKTVVTNIVEIEDVKLLINGREVESIGSHFISLYGLRAVVGY
ncbi:GerMN domain-containing protein [Thermodesulfovibrionales bacterium]|nr:GerMN domain-containing protein [Thermodesulfovibrionales bacterium]